MKNPITTITKVCGLLLGLLLTYLIYTDKPGPNFGEELNNSTYRNLIRDTSPDGKALVEVSESGNENGWHTAVKIMTDGRGMGLYAPQGTNLGIKVWWKNNDTVIVETNSEYKSVMERTAFKTGFWDSIKIVYLKK